MTRRMREKRKGGLGVAGNEGATGKGGQGGMDGVKTGGGCKTAPGPPSATSRRLRDTRPTREQDGAGALPRNSPQQEGGKDMTQEIIYKCDEQFQTKSTDRYNRLRIIVESTKPRQNRADEKSDKRQRERILTRIRPAWSRWNAEREERVAAPHVGGGGSQPSTAYIGFVLGTHRKRTGQRRAAAR